MGVVTYTGPIGGDGTKRKNWIKSPPLEKLQKIVFSGPSFCDNHINLNNLRMRYGKKLSKEKQVQIEILIIQFAELAYAKFAKGAKEHKNNLTKEIAQKEIIFEAIDLFIYGMVANSRDPESC